MLLFLTPRACSLAADIVAREAGIPIEREWVDVRAKRRADGSDFFAVNPKGQVPALVLDDGDVLTEGSVIVQHLADRAPASGLLSPELGLQRYRALEWLSFIGSELHKGFTPLFRPTTPPAYRDIAVENLRKRLGWLDSVLADRPYLTGQDFGVADAYAFTIVGWCDVHGIDMEAWPNLRAYQARIQGRPAVRDALAAERDAVRAREAA